MVRVEKHSALNLSVSFRLWQANKRSHTRLNRELKRRGLTYSELIVLGVIVLDGKGAMGQLNIKQYVAWSKMQISKLLDSLQTKHFVYRMKHFYDGRAKIVKVTPDGEAVFREVLQIIEQHDWRVVTGQSEKPFRIK